MAGPVTPSSHGCPTPKRDGSPCNAAVILNAGFCFFHDPDRAALRARGRILGGHGGGKYARLRKAIPDKLDGVWEEVRYALSGALIGELKPEAVNAACNAARTLIALHGATEVEDRLRQLEERLRGFPHTRSA